MGSSRTRAQTCVPCIGRRILNHCATREVQFPSCYLLQTTCCEHPSAHLLSLVRMSPVCSSVENTRVFCPCAPCGSQSLVCSVVTLGHVLLLATSCPLRAGEVILIELVFPWLLARLSIFSYICSNFIVLCFSILIRKTEMKLSLTVVGRTGCADRSKRILNSS